MNAPNYISNLEVGTSGRAKILGLWSIICLPPLAEWVVHPIVCKIIILEVEVIKVVTSWFDFLPLHNPDELGISPAVSH